MPQIIIDTREAVAVPDIVEALKARFDVEIKKLDSGDFVFGNGVAIERKTMNDLMKSQTQGRLADQLKALCSCYERPVLLLETFAASGLFHTGFIGANIGASPQFRGLVLSLLYSWKKLKFMYTLTREETISFLKHTATYMGPSRRIPTPKVVRKDVEPKVIYLYMLQCIRGIGPKTSRNLVTTYPDMVHLIQADARDLKRVRGMNWSSAKRLWGALHSEKE